MPLLLSPLLASLRFVDTFRHFRHACRLLCFRHFLAFACRLRRFIMPAPLLRFSLR